MNLAAAEARGTDRSASKTFMEDDAVERFPNAGTLGSPVGTHGSNRLRFFVGLTGRVESASFPFVREDLYCRYSYTYGSDWEISHGVNSGITQIARNMSAEQGVVWNFPIEISFRTFNIHGWPRIVVGVYGLDSFGRDIVRGYGSILCPTTAGIHETLVSMFTPVESSFWRRLTNWLAGTQPEFYHSNFVAQGKGRALTLVRANGSVNIVLNVMIKDIGDFGL